MSNFNFKFFGIYRKPGRNTVVKRFREVNIHIGNNIRQIRIAKNFTISELANSINVEYVQLSRIERGIISTSVSHIFFIAYGLGVNPSDLFVGLENLYSEVDDKIFFEDKNNSII